MKIIAGTVQTKSTKQKVQFDGKNADDITSILTENGFNTNQENNGKLTVEIDGIDMVIFKGDTVEINGNEVKILKPSGV